MPDPGAPIVEPANIVKRFGGVEGLSGVSLAACRGEVPRLLGDNGAGKSRLVGTLARLGDPDAGEIRVHGRRDGPGAPLAARNAGIETVFQQRAPAPRHATVTNIATGREITGRLGLIRVQRRIAAANRLMRKIGFTAKVFDPGSPVGHPLGGQRQRGAIARALCDRTDVIVPDEPTAAVSRARVVLAGSANTTRFPTDGLADLPIALAALFVGGPALRGGVGTIRCAFFAALTVTLIPAVAIGAGLAGFRTDSVFGLVIIPTLIAHRFPGARVR